MQHSVIHFGPSPEPTDVTGFPGTRSARLGADAWPLPRAKHPLRYCHFLPVSPDSSQVACGPEYENPKA